MNDTTPPAPTGQTPPSGSPAPQAANGLSGKQLRDILGPRDTVLGLLGSVGGKFALGLTLSVVFYFVSRSAGGGLLGVTSLLMYVGCLLVGLACVDLGNNLGTARERRAYHMALYDRLKSGELRADFHIPYKRMEERGYFFIDGKNGLVLFGGEEHPLADVRRLGTFKRMGKKLEKFSILLYLDGAQEPVPTVWMKNEALRNQEYKRISEFMGWR